MADQKTADQKTALEDVAEEARPSPGAVEDESSVSHGGLPGDEGAGAVLTGEIEDMPWNGLLGGEPKLEVHFQKWKNRELRIQRKLMGKKNLGRINLMCSSSQREHH